MALKTKEIAEKKSGNIAKVIFPGQHKVKLNNLELKRFSFMEAEGGYYLVMNVETEPIGEGFEGFFLDPNDESKGRYEGQVGQVKTNRYFYKDNTLPSGVQIERDQEILKQIKNLCVEADCLNWLVNADGKYDTIEELVEGFNNDKPYANVYFNMVVGGKEYLNKQNHYNYDLYLPKYKKGYTLYEAASKTSSKLLPYSEAEHVIKAERTDVEGFSSSENDTLSDLPTGEVPFDTADDMPDFDL